MKKNSLTQWGSVMLVGLLGILSLPIRTSATTLSGNVTSPVSVADQIIMNSVTNTAAIFTTDATSGNPAISVNGNNLFGADVKSASSPNGLLPIFFNDGHNVIQNAGTVQADIFASIGFFQGNYLMNGGTMQVGTWFNVGSRGNNVFVLNGGTITGNVGFVNFSGTTGDAGIDVGGREAVAPSAGGTGTLILSNGTIWAANMGVARTAFGGGFAGDHIQGFVIQEAGATVNLVSSHGLHNDAGDGNSALVISRPNNLTTVTPESSYTLRGGALSIPNANTKIYDTGRLEGYGTITSTGHRLDNSGIVRANGYGVQTTLDLSSYGVITNSIENTGAHGWYAINKGKLTLPKLTLASGTSTRLWGESAGDTTPDLVNSIKLQLNSIASGGDLTISLLASDRGDVPTSPDGRQYLSIWDFATAGGFNFGAGNADLTFRFDNSIGNGADLKLWHYEGASWSLLSSTYDDAAHTISTTGVNSFSLFAITVPEPSSVALLGLGGLLLMRRRTTRRINSSTNQGEQTNMKTMNKISGRAVARRGQTIVVAVCGLMAALISQVAFAGSFQVGSFTNSAQLGLDVGYPPPKLLVLAQHGGGAADGQDTVGAVTFTNPVPFFGANVTPGVQWGSANFGDAQLNDLMNGAVVAHSVNGNTFSKTFSGLTVGHDYLLQMLVYDGDFSAVNSGQRAGTINAGGDLLTFDYKTTIGGTGVNNKGAYVDYYFVYSAPLTVTWTPKAPDINNSNYTMIFNAFDLAELPEPSTAALLSIGGLLLVRRRKEMSA